MIEWTGSTHLNKEKLMRPFTRIIFGAATLALAGQAVQAAVVIPVTPLPGAVSTLVFGINDANVIAGS